MRTLVLTLLVVLVAAPLAQAQVNAPADPLEESRRVEAQIAKLNESKIARQMAGVRDKLDAIQRQQDQMRDGLYKELETLRESAEGKAYLERMEQLQQKQSAAWEKERASIAQAAKDLYSARHAELRKLARVDVPGLRKLKLDVLNYPLVDGSTSTHPLSVIIACRAFGVPYEWIYPEPTGSPYLRHSAFPEHLFMPGRGMAMGERDYEFYLAASRIVAKPAAADNIRQLRQAIIINSMLTVSSTTHNAYENLINGKCDLNLTARPPSEDERKLAKEKGVKIALKPIALDAFVFIVNHKNPVKSLTVSQIVDIYDGKITNWSLKSDKRRPARTPASSEGMGPMGGPSARGPMGGGQDRSNDKEILPLRRERNSGSRELFDSLIMNGRQLPDDSSWAKSMYSAGMGGPFSRITQDERALGYTVYYYEHFMSASPYTRTVAINGVQPTPQTIASRKYPLVTEVYAAYRQSDSADSPGIKLLNWLLSDEGQAVIRESGYVPARPPARPR